MSIEDKLEQYRDLKADLRQIKEAEMEMRLDLCDELGLDASSVGTHNMEYPESGLKVKMIKKVTYKLDKEMLTNIYDDLSEEERECISFEPKLSIAKYKKAGGSDLLDSAILIVPATPALEVELAS